MEFMTADEAMTALKDNKNKVTKDELKSFYDSGIVLLEKFKKTNQVMAAKKLLFHLDCCEKEIKLVENGIDTFIYADDIKTYIDKVSTDDVRLIEIENYEREIPDEVVDIIERTKGLFTDYWILYTDYAYDEKSKKSQEDNVQFARISKDPILFGIMKSDESRTISERYYFLADWIDEYCDLTLEKFIDEMRKSQDINPEHHISTPTNLEELRDQLNSIQMINGKYIMVNKDKKSFFDKIKTFLKR